MPTNSKHPETLVLHAGYRSDPATNAVAVPIRPRPTMPKVCTELRRTNGSRT